MNQEASESLNVVPWQPRDIQSLLSSAPFPWWITGGWALDLFLEKQTRPHFDTDVAVARCDQSVVQRSLPGWVFRYAVPGTRNPSAFEPWVAGQYLDREIHGVWGRPGTDVHWRFEFLFHEIESDVWSFRYGPEIQHPLKFIGRANSEGIPYLQPEIALLYKAARLREVDEQDFHRVLPHLGHGQRAQLAGDLVRRWPDHPWLGWLG